jgi:hypothetical protein
MPPNCTALIAVTMYRILADSIVVVHLTYVAFVVLGLAAIVVGACLRWRWVRNFWFRSIHFLMIAVVVGETALDITCPMTTWEDELRAAAGEDVDQSSFVGRVAHRLLFVPEDEATISETTLAVAYFAFGTAVLATLVCIPPRWPRLRKRQPGGGERP